MGATWFKTTYEGKSLQDAYKTACDEAEEYHGHQEGYNGTISTTSGVIDVTEKYNKSKFDSVEEYIRSQIEVLSKRDCHAICILKPIDNKNKTKSQVEHIVTPGTKKWILKYVVYNGYNDHMIASYLTKGDAVKKAREYTEKHQTPTNICMEKSLEKGNRTVARITYKKSTTERDGRWIFFGWAAE